MNLEHVALIFLGTLRSSGKKEDSEPVDGWKVSLDGVILFIICNTVEWKSCV